MSLISHVFLYIGTIIFSSEPQIIFYLMAPYARFMTALMAAERTSSTST